VAVLKQVVFAGFSKQTAKGSAAAAATYAVALTGGHAINFEQKNEVIETTSNKPFMFDTVRKEVIPMGDFKLIAQARSLGLLLLGVLGTEVFTGSANPWTHTFTPAQDLPYLTLFGQVGAADFFTIPDCKIDELTLEFKDPGALDVSCKMIGAPANATNVWSGSAWTITNDERGTNFFQASGGTFKLDGVSGTPIVLPVKSAVIKIPRAIGPVMRASSVLPYDVVPGPADCDVTITVIADDLSQVRKVVTGSATGTTVAQALTYGSFDLFWTYDANTDLDVSSGRIGWTVPLPQGEPKGGAAELTFTGKALGTSVNAAITAVLHNNVNAAY
jgi:hypothetical protein